MGQEGLLMGLYGGVYKGVVTNASDPEDLGRLKAQVPQLLGNLETDWAWPAQPRIAGIVPLVPGDPVWIIFEGGNTHHPVWLGTWRRVGDQPPLAPESPESDETLTWMIVSP
jgi:hypothetical protein